MNYQKLMRKEKALEIIEYIKRAEKYAQINSLNEQHLHVDEIKKENEILDEEIVFLRANGLSTNDLYSEISKNLKMDYIADVHAQKNVTHQKLALESNVLKEYIEKANHLMNQHEIIEKKLVENAKSIKREIEKKIQRDNT